MTSAAGSPEPLVVPTLTAATVAMLVAAVTYANRVGASPDTILSFPWPPAEAVVLAGALLYELGRWMGWMRVVAVVAVLLHMWLRRRRTQRAVGAWAALCVGWVAQSFVLAGEVALGLAAYAVAAVLWFAQEDRSVTMSSRSGGTTALGVAILLIALFVFLSLYGVDVYPEAHYDEVAYAIAARMQAGTIPEGPVLANDLKKFRGLAAPFLLHTLAGSHLDPGIVGLRLVSVVAGALALLVAASAMWRPLGRSPVLWLLALAAVSPLYLNHSRTAQYIMISVLQGTVTLAATLRVRERSTWLSTAFLALLVGGSVYFYQLSWFVPILVGATFLAVPEMRRRRGTLRRVAATLALAAVVALPAFTIRRDALQAVNAQTFDHRAVWSGWFGARSQPARAAVFFLVPKWVTGEDLTARSEALRAEGLQARVVKKLDGHTEFIVSGPPALVHAARDALEASSGTVHFEYPQLTSPWANVAAILHRLFVGPGFEEWGRIIDAPVLNPVLAPLLVLGLCEAVRRRREAPVRIVLVWVVLGGLLPAVVGGVLPRRALLAFPAALALAGLAIERVRVGLLSGGGWALAWGASLAGALVIVVLTTDIYAFFRRWNGGWDPSRPCTLQLRKVVKSIPREQRVLVALDPFTHPSVPVGYFAQVEDETIDRGRSRVAAIRALPPDAATIRRRSCQTRRPFVWIVSNLETYRDAFRALADGFRYEEETRGPYRVYHVHWATPGACTGAEDGRRLRNPASLSSRRARRTNLEPHADPAVEDLAQGAILLPAGDHLTQESAQGFVGPAHGPRQVLLGERLEEPEQAVVAGHGIGGDAPDRRRVVDEVIDLLRVQRRGARVDAVEAHERRVLELLAREELARRLVHEPNTPAALEQHRR